MTAPVPVPPPRSVARARPFCPSCSRTIPVWLEVSQVARELDVSKMTVYRLIERKELLAHRMGRTIRVRAVDLDHFLVRSRTDAVDQARAVRR